MNRSFVTNPAAFVRASSGPAANGLKAWAYDPAAAASNGGTTAGLLYGVKVPIDGPTLITNVCLCVNTAGGTLTADQCFAALFDASGALLSVTASQHTAWQSTGGKVMALAAPQNVDGPHVYVCWFSNGTTRPAMARGNSVGSGSNIGLTTATARFFNADTGLTTAMPATIGTKSFENAHWAGVS